MAGQSKLGGGDLLANVLFGLLILTSGGTANASTENIHSTGKTVAFGISQRAQEELGYASGFFITDLSATNLMAPNFELALRIRLLTSYGPTTVFNFASSGSSPQSSGNASSTGLDRPLIRARQLMQGNFYNGRWFIIEFGLPIFNATGYAPEFYRYFSGHVAFHEQIEGKYVNPNIEIGTTVRSLTQFKQPGDTGLIYPPTLEALVGLQKTFHHVHLASDFKIEQALTETSTAGSYDTSKVKPAGAITRLQIAYDAGYAFSDKAQFYLRYAQRVYRWPDDDSAALWSTFDEASLGRSIELQWRGEW